MPQLTLEYWEDDGWFVGRLVEVPGIFSQGETVEELKENVQDAYKLMLESEPMEPFTTPRNLIPLDVRTVVRCPDYQVLNGPVSTWIKFDFG